MLALCKQGDEIVSASTLYGGTYALFEVNLRNLGINTTFVNPDDPQNFKKAITKKTKLLYAETHRQSADQRARHRADRENRA